MTAHTQLLVYNSENRFVGFFYQFTCRVERTKGLKDKTEFWDRLIARTNFQRDRRDAEKSLPAGLMRKRFAEILRAEAEEEWNERKKNVLAHITEPSNNDYDNDVSDHNFGTFDDFGVKNDQKVSHNMILMSKYKGQHGGKKAIFFFFIRDVPYFNMYLSYTIARIYRVSPVESVGGATCTAL